MFGCKVIIHAKMLSAALPSVSTISVMRNTNPFNGAEIAWSLGFICAHPVTQTGRTPGIASAPRDGYVHIHV